MTPLEVSGLTVFILLLLLGIYSTVYGLPGTLLILICIVVFAFFDGFDTIGLKHIVVLTVLSAVVETADALVGVANIRRPRVTPGVVASSLAGTLLGVILLTPALYGAGTVMGIFLGGLAGLLIAQKVEQRTLKPALREPAKATFLRGLTVCAKGCVAMGATFFVLSRLYS